METLLPRHIRQHIVRLAIAHPFTARELARIIRDGYHYAIDYRGMAQTQHLRHQPPSNPSKVSIGIYDKEGRREFDGFTLVEPKTCSLSWYCQQG